MSNSIGATNFIFLGNGRHDFFFYWETQMRQMYCCIKVQCVALRGKNVVSRIFLRISEFFHNSIFPDFLTETVLGSSLSELRGDFVDGLVLGLRNLGMYFSYC